MERCSVFDIKNGDRLVNEPDSSVSYNFYGLKKKGMVGDMDFQILAVLHKYILLPAPTIKESVRLRLKKEKVNNFEKRLPLLASLNFIRKIKLLNEEKEIVTLYRLTDSARKFMDGILRCSHMVPDYDDIYIVSECAMTAQWHVVCDRQWNNAVISNFYMKSKVNHDMYMDTKSYFKIKKEKREFHVFSVPFTQKTDGNPFEKIEKAIDDMKARNQAVYPIIILPSNIMGIESFVQATEKLNMVQNHKVHYALCEELFQTQTPTLYGYDFEQKELSKFILHF